MGESNDRVCVWWRRVPWARAAVSVVAGFVVALGVAWGISWRGQPIEWNPRGTTYVVVNGEDWTVDVERSAGRVTYAAQYFAGRLRHQQIDYWRTLEHVRVVSCEELPGSLRRWLSAIDRREYNGDVRSDRFGFPMIAVEARSAVSFRHPINVQVLEASEDSIFTASWLPGSPELPSRLVRVGLIVNTLFYASIVFALSLLPGTARCWRRRRRGLCIGCGYDLAGAGGSCPECGRRAAGATERPRA